jgi:hypothetical protein
MAQEDRATQERVRAVGEFSQDEEPVAPPVGREARAQAGDAIDHDEHRSPQRQGSARRLATGQALPEQGRREQHHRHGLHDDEEGGVGDRGAHNAPV